MDIEITSPEDPRLLKIHAERLRKRDIDQLLGICEFALQDNMVDQSEAEAIFTWLKSHRACLDTWPASILYDRLQSILSDGHLDEEEHKDLLGLIMQIARPRNNDGTIAASTLPLTIPEPEIVVENRSFCFTGVFQYGSRADCINAVETRQGKAANSVTKKLDYLVIGSIGSEVWRHSSFGSKILKAVDYRAVGSNIAIVSEPYWLSKIS